MGGAEVVCNDICVACWVCHGKAQWPECKGQVIWSLPSCSPIIRTQHWYTVWKWLPMSWSICLRNSATDESMSCGLTWSPPQATVKPSNSTAWWGSPSGLTAAMHLMMLSNQYTDKTDAHVCRWMWGWPCVCVGGYACHPVCVEVRGQISISFPCCRVSLLSVMLCTADLLVFPCHLGCGSTGITDVYHHIWLLNMESAIKSGHQAHMSKAFYLLSSLDGPYVNIFESRILLSW